MPMLYKDRCDNCHKIFDEKDFLITSHQTHGKCFCSLECMHSYMDKNNIKIEDVKNEK